MKKISIFILKMAILSFWTNSLFAQSIYTTGVNLQRVNPCHGPSKYLNLPSAETLPQKQLQFRLVNNLAYGEVLTADLSFGEQELVHAIDTQHVCAAYGLTNRIQLEMGVPLHLYARESQTNGDTFSTGGLGDMSVGLAYQALKEGRFHPALTVRASGTAPSGSESRFLGTNGFTSEINISFKKDWGFLSADAVVGSRFVPQETVFGIDFNDEMLFGAGVTVPLSFIDEKTWATSEVTGQFQYNNIDRSTTPLEYTIGMHRQFTPQFQLGAGAGGKIINAIGAPQVRGFLDLQYLWGKEHDSH